MPETFVISTGRTTGRWLKTLQYIQHSPRIAVRMVFANEESAMRAYKRFRSLLNKYSGQLTMVAHHSGREVYLFKPEHFDKAVIDDEKRKTAD